MGLGTIITYEKKPSVRLSEAPFDRNWLSLLSPDPCFGLTFNSDILYASDFLGFSHQANKWGLKGPDNNLAPSVICGTSFGMGVGVDQGLNWYDLLNLNETYFNISFPVGTKNHIARLNAIYRGSHAKLVFIYHPNIWFTSRCFENAALHGKNIFEFMGWDKRLGNSRVINKNLWRTLLKRTLRVSSTVSVNGQKFSLNRRYCVIKNNETFIQNELGQLNLLFSKFKKTICIRVPIREEVAHHSGLFENGKSVKQFDQLWDQVIKLVQPDECLDLSRNFKLSDYHSKDNHWNLSGNYRFSEMIAEYL